MVLSYARQDKVTLRLHFESLRALEDLGSIHRDKLFQIWGKTRRELRGAIMEAHEKSSRMGKWNLPRFKHSGSQAYLHAEVLSILEQFRAISKNAIKEGLNDIYKNSTMRHAWLLDQVTPPSRNVRIPHSDKLHEAAVRTLYLGGQGASDWKDRWDLWIDAYRDALGNNVAMNAMNESSMTDAANEVDVTKANTPSFTITDAMDRLFDYEGIRAMSAGAQSIADLNADLVEEEIWKTRGDDRVCDDCDELEGDPIESTGYPPAHPNCHCYPLIVPLSYAELLRSGDASDADLADAMMARGLVPNALAIRDEDGNITAKAIVSFEDWMSGQGNAISTL